MRLFIGELIANCLKIISVVIFGGVYRKFCTRQSQNRHKQFLFQRKIVGERTEPFFPIETIHAEMKIDNDCFGSRWQQYKYNFDSVCSYYNGMNRKLK